VHSAFICDAGLASCGDGTTLVLDYLRTADAEQLVLASRLVDSAIPRCRYCGPQVTAMPLVREHRTAYSLRAAMLH
jgi:hypothetical protein